MTYRSTTITVTSHDVTEEYSLTQCGSSPYFGFDPKEIVFPEEGAVKEVTVNANLPWSVKNSVSWITLNPYVGEGQAVMEVTVGQNPENTPRSAKLFFETDNGLKDTIYVEQVAATPTVEIDPISKEVSYEEGVVEFKIYYNISTAPTVENNTPWIDLNGNLKPKESTVTLEYEENQTGEERECIIPIVFTLENGEILEYSFTLTQLAKPTMIDEVKGKDPLIVPNPAKEWIKIRCQEGTKFVIIRDMNSKEVWSKKRPKAEEKVSTSRWPAGTYFIHVLTPNSLQKEKFIISD